MKRHSFRWLVAAAAAFALVAASCGGDDEPETTVSSDTGASQAEIDAAQAAADDARAAAEAAEARLAEAQAAADEASAEQQAEAQAALAEAEAEAEAARAEAASAAAAAEAAQAEADAAAAEAEAAQAEAEQAQADAAEAEAALAEAIAEGDIADAATVDMDTNGDGRVLLGVAAAGPRDDGAYYQALVDAATEISAAQGWDPPIVIDNIEPAVADTELENLVAQGVDIIAVGAGEIADPLPDLVERYPEVFWYCNCGTGYPQTPGVALSTNDGAEIEYVVGVAAGLILQERGEGGTTAYMIGCCDLGFEVETELAMRLGMKSVDPSYDVVYTPTGNYPFDFDNVAGATEAFNVALDAGMDLLYPYLGGAHEPLVQLANEHGIPVTSAGASDVCTRTDLHWDMAALFDGGDFARAVFPLIVSGQFEEGSIYKFAVGRDPEVGALICGATAEQQSILEQAHADVFNGHCLAEFDAIRAISYGGVEMEAPLVCADA